MNEFRRLFGAEKREIKTTCVLLPFFRKEILRFLGVKKISRGKLYGVGKASHFTVIHTGMGAVFLGDAVLHLKETACRQLILFGACGLIAGRKELGIGSLVSPTKCYASESFSRMLSETDEPRPEFYPDRELQSRFLSRAEPAGVKEVVALSVGSLKLQEERLDSLRREGAEVVDLECAAFFAAARATGRSALALLFITDVVGEKPYYRRLSVREKLALLKKIRRGGRLICGFIKENRGD